MSRRQTTIRREVSRQGIGLHSGIRVNLRLLPAKANQGVCFVRTDRDHVSIPASHEFLDRCQHATTLRRDDVTVETVEHLLSALYGAGIDNVIAELDAPELPILDGSADSFLDLIREAGRRELGEDQWFLQVRRPVGIVEQGEGIVVVPADHFAVSYYIDFPHPAIGRQERTVAVDPQSFETEISPARTFTFVHEVDALRRMGLALGGSLTNAVVLDDRRLLNSTLRFPDEFVRHKLLDLIGDLCLLGRPLLGHVMALKAGHDLHGRLVSRLMACKDAWTLVKGASVSSRAPQAALPSAAPGFLSRVPVRLLARRGIPALLCLVLGLLWAAASAPAHAAPRVVNLIAEWREGGYRVSFQLQDAFEQKILDTIASGLPVTFEYRVEVFQRRTMWPDLVHLQQLVRVSVDFDSLTRQYSLRREVDGQVVDSSSTEKPEEMRAWMTRLADVDLGKLPDTLKRTGREQLRVKCRLASGFVFFFFPDALESRWAKVPLPVEVEPPEPAEAEEEVP